MIIRLKNKQTLLYKDFSFKCCIGKNGLTNTKFEGDKNTLIEIRKKIKVDSTIIRYVTVKYKKLDTQKEFFKKEK